MDLKDKMPSMLFLNNFQSHQSIPYQKSHTNNTSIREEILKEVKKKTEDKEVEADYILDD